MKPSIDTRKLTGLGTFNADLDRKYGKVGTPSRGEFDAKSKAWYCAECLKQARKKAGLTQKEVAEKIGKKREYVALIERGETDMQLSTFIMISEAVGLQFSLTF